MPFTLQIKRISPEVTSYAIREALGPSLAPDTIEIMMDGTAIIYFSDASLFNYITLAFYTLYLRVGSQEYKLELPKNSYATVVLNRVPIYISQDVLQVQVNYFLRKRGIKPCVANIFYRKVKSYSANLVFMGSHDAQAAMKVLANTDFTREITASCGLGHLIVIETDVADQRHGKSNDGEVFYIVARCYDQSVVQQKAEQNEIEIKKQQDNLSSQLYINYLTSLGQQIQPSALPVVQYPILQSSQPFMPGQQVPPYYSQFVQYAQPTPQFQPHLAQSVIPPAQPFFQAMPIAPPPMLVPSIGAAPIQVQTFYQYQNKPSSTSIYVANVPADVYETAVKEAFEAFGPVFTSYKIYNGKTPFACYIIQFKDNATAPHILQERPTVTIGGVTVQIRPHITKAKR